MARGNRKIQLDLWKDSQRSRLIHGGQLLKSNPKTRRPLSTKHSIHLVMRSSRAIGRFSMLGHAPEIDQIIHRQAKRFGVKIYRFANVGNHLHALLRITSAKLFAGFLRAISGLIAREVLGAERGAAKGLRFWDARPFTRIVAWGRAFKAACSYLIKNELEAMGFAIEVHRVKSRGPPKSQIHWPLAALKT